MNKFLSFLMVIIPVVLLSSCLTIERNPVQGMEEMGSRTYELVPIHDIFDQQGWMLPPFSQNRLDFANGQATWNFKGQVMKFTLQGKDGMKLEYAGVSLESKETPSKADRYYNLGTLKYKPVQRHRQVAKTRFENQQVAVTKTRFVQKTRQVYDSMSKGFRTEWYTDTEFYTEFETRQVMKTDWEWQTVTEMVPDIPVYPVCSFVLPDNELLSVFRDQDAWYVQNSTAMTFQETVPGLFGTVTVKSILLDKDADGVWTESGDMAFFNTWNPYFQGSQYNESMMYDDNTWQSLESLKTRLFLSYQPSPDFKSVTVGNLNSLYADDRRTGSFSIRDIPNAGLYNGSVDLNGGIHYLFFGATSLEARIQYGFYHLVVKVPDASDFIRDFEVNEGHDNIKIVYGQDPWESRFVLKAAWKMWKISLTDAAGNTRSYRNTSVVDLVPGSYTVVLTGDGISFEKKFEISKGETCTYNMENDTLTKS